MQECGRAFQAQGTAMQRPLTFLPRGSGVFKDQKEANMAEAEGRS